MPLDRGGEQGGQRSWCERVHLLGDLGGKALGKLVAEQLQMLLVQATKRTVTDAALQVQLLLHFITPGVSNLVTELAELDQVASHGALGDAGAFGKLVRVEARFSDHHGKDA